MGIDFGLKKTGIAIGQTISCTANPLDILPSKPVHLFWEGLQNLVRQWRPDAFVLGVPRSGLERKHPLIPGIIRLTRRLQQEYRKPVYLVDEQLTSHEAAQQLSPKQKKALLRKQFALDSIAAKIILETWLKNPHNHLQLDELEKSL